MIVIVTNLISLFVFIFIFFCISTRYSCRKNVPLTTKSHLKSHTAYKFTTFTTLRRNMRNLCNVYTEKHSNTRTTSTNTIKIVIFNYDVIRIFNFFYTFFCYWCEDLRLFLSSYTIRSVSTSFVRCCYLFFVFHERSYVIYDDECMIWLIVRFFCFIVWIWTRMLKRYYNYSIIAGNILGITKFEWDHVKCVKISNLNAFFQIYFPRVR